MHNTSKRTFDVPRLKSFAGYAERPVVQDALSYFIPAFSVVSARLVAFRHQLFEIWSPNSAQTPFYPGLRDFTVRLSISLPPSQRRCDGHMGRFDPTISPQHYNPQIPWLPFIRRLSDGSHPEHQAFLTVWRPTSGSNRGMVDPHYLRQLASRSQSLLYCLGEQATIEGLRPAVWEGRPTGPSPQDIERVLGGERTFDHTVDFLSRVQTDLKIMSAWIRMAHLVIQGSDSNSSPITPIPDADDSMVGVWLNGTTEEDGLWLLQHGVPCFIIHEVEKPAHLRRVMQNSDRLPNFWQNTPVASLCFDVNPVDVAVSRDRGILHDLETDIGLATQAPEADGRSRDRSSPHAQGFVDGCYQDPRVPTPSRFAPPEITVVNGMVIPPPVALVKQGKQWSRWIWETNSEGEGYLSRVGKRNEDGGSFKYYDRENCRSLLLDDRLKAPEHYFADPAIYGLPAPRVRYYEPGNKELYERAGSHWVYLQKEPKRENIGRKYTPPASTSALIPPRNTTDDDELGYGMGGGDSPILGYDVPSTSAPIPPRDTMGDDELDWSDSPILGPVPSTAERQVVPSLSLQPSSPRFPRSPPQSRSSSSRWRSRSPLRRNRAPPPPFPRSCFPSARIRLSSPPRRPRPRSRSPYMPRGSRRSSPGRHSPRYQQFRPLPREEWRADGSEDSSPVAGGPSRLGGINDRSVPDVSEPFSGGSFTSQSRVTVDSSEQWEMDVSDEPSVGRPPRSGGEDVRIMSSVPIEPLSGSPSFPGIACLAETPSTAALPPDTESWGMDTTEGPTFSIAPFGGINDEIAESSVADAMEPISTGPSLPLAARLSEAPSVAANSPVGKTSWRMDTTEGPVVNAIEPLSAGPSLPLEARLSKAPSIAANPPADKERMLALFPVPTSTDIPLNSVISASSQSRFLVIWNLPGHFVWRDVVTWLEKTIAYLKPRPVLERMARTNQRGDQAFWLKFSTILGASAFRGMVAGRQAADTPIILCDYVDGDEYSGALSRSSDSWTPKGGFMGDVSPTAPFPAPSATEMKAIPLADRLAPHHRRTHRGKKKRVKMPEDMQT